MQADSLSSEGTDPRTDSSPSRECLDTSFSKLHFLISVKFSCLFFFFFDAVVIEICKESSEKTDGESEGKLGIIQSGLNSDGLSLGKAQAGGQDGLMGGGLGSRRGHK